MSAMPKPTGAAVQEAFRAHVLQTLGLSYSPSTAFQTDGEVHHATPIGDKYPNKFWYRIYATPYVHGRFGHYPTDGGPSGHVWEPDLIEALSPQDIALLAEQARTVHDEEARRRRDLAEQRRSEVHSEYLAARTVTSAADHGYLARKGIDTPSGDWKETKHSFKRPTRSPFTNEVNDARAPDEPALMVPLRTIASPRFAGVQYIANDGKKDFPYGIPVKGSCHQLGGYVATKPIFLCEGVATAHVVHRLTACMTVACLSADGFRQIAKDVRKEFGEAALIVACAERGGGHAQAVEAAQATGGKLCEPPWLDGDTGTDFDDYCRAHGDEAARHALEVFAEPAAMPVESAMSDALSKWLGDVNKEFFVAGEWGSGRACIGRVTSTGIEPVDEQTLRLVLGNRRPPRVDKPPHTFWMASKGRREYRRVAYDPEWKTLDREQDRNLWQGFAVEPKAGDWSLMRNHICDNIAAGNEAVFRHVVGLLACIVQHPGSPCGVALVLQGEEGTGKGTLANAMLELFGRHAYRSSDPRMLTGEFTGHLERVSFFYADEMSWAGDKTLREKLWSLITDPRMDIHHKGRTPYIGPNCMNFVLSTNKEHAAPIHKGNRRIFLIEVRDPWDHLDGEEKKAARDAYFAPLHRQLYQQGGLAAMLHDLLQMDLTGFNVRAFPTTTAMTYNVALSMPSLDQWIVNLVRAGWAEGEPLDKAALYGRYRQAGRDMGDRYPSPEVQFWKRLKRVLGEVKGAQPRDKVGGRKRVVYLPSVAAAREHAERALGVPIEGDE